MKKIVLSAAVAALLATPAVARVITVEFKNDKGETNVISFDDATNKATNADGASYDYTYDEAARKLCGTPEGGEICVTFEGEAGEVKAGLSGPYTASNGNKGVATVTEVKE